MKQQIPNILRTIRENFNGQQHRPVSEELAIQMTENIDSDAVVGLFDAGCVIALTLIDKGHDPSKIYVIEKSLEKCYTEFSKSISKRFGFNVIQPPMGNINRIDMNFDVIIGNPPYSETGSDSTNNKGLDNVFYKFATEKSEYVSMIIRSNHLVNQSSSFRKELFSSGYVSKIEFLSSDVFRGVYVRTCIVTFDKNHNGTTEIKTLNGDTTNIDISSDTIIHPTNGVLSSPTNNLAHRWKRGKLNLNQIEESTNGVTFVKALGRKDQDIQTCVIDPSLESFGYKKHGVLIPNMGTDKGGIGKVVIKPYEAVAGHSIVQFWTDTEEEAIELVRYLQSDKVTKLIKAIKFSNPNPKSLFSLIEDPLK